MKRLSVCIAFIFSSLCAFAQTGAVQGFCTQGAVPAVTSGSSSANTLQGVIAGCTVTVYLHGTTTLATIYKDSNGTPLSNPFTANLAGATNAGGWIFYAATSQGVDIFGSGGGGNPACATQPKCYTASTPLAVAAYPSTAITVVTAVLTAQGASPVEVNGASGTPVSGAVTISCPTCTIGGGTPGGSNTQIQYNNSGVFGGASGGLTNGTHWAFGDGAAIDSVPLSAPDQYFQLPPAAISIFNEHNTSPNMENGIYTEVDLDPASPATISPLLASGMLTVVNASGPNLSAVNGGWQAVNDNVNSPDTDDWGVSGDAAAVYLNGTAPVTYATGQIIEAQNFGTAVVSQLIGAEVGADNFGSGTISLLNGVDVAFGDNGTGTDTLLNMIHVESPNDAGAAVGTTVGLQIDDQSTGGGATQGIDQEGATDENDFNGPTIFSNNVTLSNISGSTQCLHVNTSGLISGTGADCPTGGGGAD